MARKWFPSPDECFVFRDELSEEKIPIVLLIPGGEEPRSVAINGDEYTLDMDRTDLVRMYVRVAERKRTGDLDSDPVE